MSALILFLAIVFLVNFLVFFIFIERDALANCLMFFITLGCCVAYGILVENFIQVQNILGCLTLCIFYFGIGYQIADAEINYEIKKTSNKFKMAVLKAKRNNPRSEKELVDAVLLTLSDYKRRDRTYIENKTYKNLVKAIFPTKTDITFSYLSITSAWLLIIIIKIGEFIVNYVVKNLGENQQINTILNKNPLDEGEL